MRLHEFLVGAGSKPYRELIQHHIRKQTVPQMSAGVMGEVALLPSDLQPAAMSFIDVLNVELLRSQEFWERANCGDAVNAIVRMANQHFALNLPLPVDSRSMSGIEQEFVFGLFQIATISFAYTAASQPNARKFMGIRKSLFFR